MVDDISTPNELQSVGVRLKMSRRVDIVLAIVLLAASGLKAYQILTNSFLVVPGILQSKTLLATLVQVELLLAAWMWVGTYPRVRFIVAISCFLAFTGAACYEATRGLASCGCFGPARVSPKVMAAIDITAVLALWFTRPRKTVRFMASPWRTSATLIICVIVSAAFWIVFGLGLATEAKPSQTVDLVVLEPQSWLNKPLAIVEDIDFGEPLKQGRWILVFYHYDCDTCLRAIPAYLALARSAQHARFAEPRIAFIAMPPVAPLDQDPITNSPEYLHLTLRSVHEWFATTPVVVAIDNGTVVWSADGEDAINPPVIAKWPGLPKAAH